MSGLAELGLTDLVRGWIADERPYLGICLGMQVLFDRSEEDDQPGLGVLAGRVTKLPNTVPVPHMGWNEVNDTYFYFDHSFAAQPDEESTVTGWCEHGARFAARVDSGSITGVQFHPEKSGPDGIALLKEWIADS
jgi:glutamine amidotransferase